jgi:hypothetical protein
MSQEYISNYRSMVENCVLRTIDCGPIVPVAFVHDERGKFTLVLIVSFRIVQLLFGVCVLVIWIISYGSKWTTADGDFVHVLRTCVHVSGLRE